MKLSSYWSELNLIEYKIELLNKNKGIGINNDNELKELEKGIINVGNIISGLIESKKRHCFHCGNKKTARWHRYLSDHFLCNTCGDRHRKKTTNTKTSSRNKENGKDKYNACGAKQWRQKNDKNLKGYS
uniref:GATA-type domain-containing protein n=1 Tax=Meloidogyne hapla TaxID=6305 RepID=A0A1I8BAT4_MELHA